MLDELALSGYEEASVERARAAAGVSTAEFEEEFAGKDQCLFAAYDRLTDQVVARARLECDGGGPWPERIRGGLEALLDELAAEPRMARALTRSFPGIRPAAYERYVNLLGRFVPFMEEGRNYAEVDEELPGEVELLAVGSAEAIIFGEVDAGRAERLPQMLPEILFSVLVPFMGPDRAADEMRIAAASI
ncbi:MAG: TetR/AcrR family transcriptional regulator [Solirubrobacterales bacterium]